MKPYIKKSAKAILMTLLISVILTGCGRNNTEAEAEIHETQTETPAPSPSVPADSEIIILDDEEEPTIPMPEQVLEEEYDTPGTNPHPLQIVFLGDTNLDNYRDSTGIAYLVGKECEARVYNLAIAGTNVALIEDDGINTDNINRWNSKSLLGMSKILAGHESERVLRNTRAGELLKDLNVAETDYFILFYNVYDFYHRIPLNTENYDGGVHTYVGAYRQAIENLREAAPFARIFLCSPYYTNFFDQDGHFIGSGHIVSNGLGTQHNYKEKSEYIAKEQRTLFVDGYKNMGIDGHTAEDMLADGVNLSEKGRKAYAEHLSRRIMEYEKKLYN